MVRWRAQAHSLDSGSFDNSPNDRASRARITTVYAAFLLAQALSIAGAFARVPLPPAPGVVPLRAGALVADPAQDRLAARENPPPDPLFRLARGSSWTFWLRTCVRGLCTADGPTPTPRPPRSRSRCRRKPKPRPRILLRMVRGTL